MKKIISNRAVINLILAAVAILLPVISKANDYILNVMILTLLYILLSFGLNLLLGYTGQISIGHAAFYSIGAYTTALLSVKLDAPFIVCLIFSIIVTFLFGILLGFTSHKLDAIFLAIVTMAFGNIIRLVLMNWREVTGGINGIRNISGIMLFGEKMTKFQFYYLALFFLAVIMVISYNLVNSKTGRAFMAVRDAPIAAESMGINVNRYKLLIFAISAAFAGVAGSLYAKLVGYISPDAFTADMSIRFLTIVIVGGLGSFYGPLAGGIVVGVLPELLRSFESFSMVAYGLMIVLVLKFAPRGIMGGIEKVVEYLKAKFKTGTKKDASAGGTK
ncbi:MAG TPA: branched-chain amino acid ABC transporter permease [Clostridiales bacterium]|nr:branched-chain amino acid ABC transporter permease [Clostridiales bacterium]